MFFVLYLYEEYIINGKIYNLNLEIDEIDINRSLNLYKKQCKHSFGNKALTDNGMAYSISVGIKNNNFPFLRYILDIYMRHSLNKCLYYNRYISKDPIFDIHTLNDYTIKDWAIQCNLLHKIKNIDFILSAMDKYLRICPRLHINPLMLIKDDIYEIARYFLMAYNLIKHIIIDHVRNKKKSMINFQFDFGIVCNGSVQKKGSCVPQLWSDDEDTFNILYPNQPRKQNKNDSNIKWDYEPLSCIIGDIYSRFTSNNLKFAMNKMKINRFPQNLESLKNIDDLQMELLINLCRKTYSIYHLKMKNKIINFAPFKYRNNKYEKKSHSNNYNILCDEIDKLNIFTLLNVMESISIFHEMKTDRIVFNILNFMSSHNANKQLLCNLIARNNNDIFIENQQIMFNTFNEFRLKSRLCPNQSRFCSIIDRRTNPIKPQYTDTVYFFQPKDNYCLPANIDIFPEKYFDSTQTSFLPKQTSNDKKITSNSLCNGKLLILTFIIESVDVIQCYLFRDSTFIRFLPSDIISILPKLFLASYANNTSFQTDDIAQTIVNGLNYSDKNFQFWYNGKNNT